MKTDLIGRFRRLVVEMTVFRNDFFCVSTTRISSSRLLLMGPSFGQVTFARMLDLVSMELHSSSETDISAGEEAASIRSTGRDQKLANQTEPRHPPRRKARNWSSRRFWRTPNSNSSTQGSASDHDFEQTIPAIVHNEPKVPPCTVLHEDPNPECYGSNRAAACGSRIWIVLFPCSLYTCTQ